MTGSLMRIMKLAKYRLKAQVEKDEGPSGEGQSPRTYQGNPCGVYPDLSSFTGSGVYPDLSSFTGSGVYPDLVYPDLSSFTGSGVYHDLSSFIGSGVNQKLYSLYQAIRAVRWGWDVQQDCGEPRFHGSWLVYFLALHSCSTSCANTFI
ncbi:hypothetical protein HKD37_08G022474 [Glycine soja]